MDNIFLEEQEYLEKVEKIIEEEIEKSATQLKKLISDGKALSFEDRKRGEHFNVNSKADMVSSRIKMLERSIPIPYFGRVDVSFTGNENDKHKIYIGRSGISTENNIFVTDWRAPISSIYYDSEIGEVNYDSPNGEEHANMFLKRQINIKDSKLIDVQDSSLVTNDELLKPYLETNADSKMKTIIASIQKEQNLIIRRAADRNMIIQGVAGSGKTSVALHRIAYLIYALGQKMTSDEFLVLGPNDYFLNYVSSVLPNLETKPVQEETFLKYAREYTGENITLKGEKRDGKMLDEKKYRNVQAFKTSLEYKELIEKFLDEYLKDEIVPYDFMVLNEVVFNKEKIRRLLFLSNPSFPDYDRLINLMIKDLKDNYVEIYDSLNAKYKAKYMSLDFDDPVRKEMVEYSHNLYNSLKNNASTLVRNYVKSIKLKTTAIYSKFILSLSSALCQISDQDIQLLQQTTLNDIKNNKTGFEDLPALIHIKYKLSNKTNDITQLIIDEAQDYGMFHFAVLKETNPKSVFSIYGDLAQSIYSYRSIKNWDEVNERIFDNQAELLYLNRSYRTTIEITETANNILSHLELKKAEPVIRHGVNVDFIDSSLNNTYKYSLIKDMIQKKFETIAIICKDEQELKAVHKELEKANISARVITDKDSEYSSGIFVMTSAAAKGLEFDGVIINDASEEIYDSNSDVDMHLLYVATTRALHELCVLYKKKLTQAFSNMTYEVETNEYNNEKVKIKTFNIKK